MITVPDVPHPETHLIFIRISYLNIVTYKIWQSRYHRYWTADLLKVVKILVELLLTLSLVEAAHLEPGVGRGGEPADLADMRLLTSVQILMVQHVLLIIQHGKY